MSIAVSKQISKLASNYCFTTPEQFKNDILACLSLFVSGNFNGLIIQANTPAVGDRDKAWFKTDQFGRPERLYLFQGQWISKHAVDAGAQQCIIWKGSESDLWAYDGGDGSDPSVSAPTATTGAMWLRDTTFDFRFPVGIGANPVSYDGNPATAIAPGDTGGEQRHKLVNDESAAVTHAHLIGRLDNAGQIDLYMRSATAVPAQSGAAFRVKGNGAEVSADLSSLNKQDVITAGINNAPLSGGVPGFSSHENMPPWKAVIFAVRSARIFYTA